MDVLEAVRTMRAVRQFAETELPEKAVTDILNAGRRAQSSKNEQPWQFVAITDRDVLRQLSECGTFAGHLAGAALGVALVGRRESGIISFDLGQAAAFMMLTAWEHGIGSCLAAMWEPQRAKQILGIPEEMDFRIAISFGYPAGNQTRPAVVPGGRKAMDEIVHWNRW